MMRQPQGPRREKSVESYLRRTRILAVIALAAVAGGVASDVLNGTFWAGHALLAGLVASVLVVMLSLAVVNEVLERRRRQRWSVLAQYVMFELVRNARMVWTGILELADLLPPGDPQGSVAAGAHVVRDTARLTAALRAAVDDADRRTRLHSEIAFLAEHAEEVLGRWAGIMLNAEMYAEIVDRHVELAGDIAWIGGLMDGSRPPSDVRRQKRARSSPATQIRSDPGPEWLADRLVVIVQLAEALDRGTLELALRIVPVQWWEDRLRNELPAPPAGER